MMVKKNLAYVNSQELDQMDIMTSDLDVPADQLHLQVRIQCISPVAIFTA